ncbi:hypothetical protein JHW43_003949 [Diplocarpon mali]|nr:hypothetical protein JHW43_003949 [Diplocarpon mali]
MVSPLQLVQHSRTAEASIHGLNLAPGIISQSMVNGSVGVSSLEFCWPCTQHPDPADSKPSPSSGGAQLDPATDLTSRSGWSARGKRDLAYRSGPSSQHRSQPEIILQEMMIQADPTSDSLGKDEANPTPLVRKPLRPMKRKEKQAAATGNYCAAVGPWEPDMVPIFRSATGWLAGPHPCGFQTGAGGETRPASSRGDKYGKNELAQARRGDTSPAITRLSGVLNRTCLLTSTGGEDGGKDGEEMEAEPLASDVVGVGVGIVDFNAGENRQDLDTPILSVGENNTRALARHHLPGHGDLDALPCPAPTPGNTSRGADAGCRFRCGHGGGGGGGGELRAASCELRRDTSRAPIEVFCSTFPFVAVCPICGPLRIEIIELRFATAEGRLQVPQTEEIDLHQPPVFFEFGLRSRVPKIQALVALAAVVASQVISGQPCRCIGRRSAPHHSTQIPLVPVIGDGVGYFLLVPLLGSLSATTGNRLVLISPAPHLLWHGGLGPVWKRTEKFPDYNPPAASLIPVRDDMRSDDTPGEIRPGMEMQQGTGMGVRRVPCRNYPYPPTSMRLDWDLDADVSWNSTGLYWTLLCSTVLYCALLHSALYCASARVGWRSLESEDDS